MNAPDRDTRDLQMRLHAWITSAPPGFQQHADRLEAAYGVDTATFAALEDRFESLALDMFAYQYERVDVFRRCCDDLGRTPRNVDRAADVPYLTADAFKLTRVASFPAHADVLSFRTSGTTTPHAGTHVLATRDLYELALERSFVHHVLPDTDRMRMFRVVPAFREGWNSSLAYMLDHVCARRGTRESGCFAHAGGIHWPELRAALLAAAADAEPVCLLGTTLGWAHVLDLCEAAGFDVELPAGSRLMHTGGDKGRRRSVEGSVFLQQIEARFGIARTHVVGEYGMTELGSQCYTLGLRDALRGDSDRDDARWSFPMWLRPRIVNAETGGFSAAPDVGLLAFHDLANLGSVAHVLTADLGVPDGASFVLEGRAPRAELRGCGLATETWPTAPRPEPVVAKHVAAAAPVSLPRASHLPAAIQADRHVHVRVGATELLVPALDASAVSETWEHLATAATAWRGLALAERVARIARLAAWLAAEGPGPWRDALARSTGLAPAGLDAAWGVTFAPTTAAAIDRLLADERLDAATLARLESAGRLPHRIVHVLSGNVLPATWHVLVRGWLLGAAQWLRPATREPLFAACVLDRAGRFAPELAASTAVLWWPHASSDLEANVLAAADAVTVQGDDTSVAAVCAKVARAAPAARCVGYDSRWSAAWIAAACQTEATARGLSRDVALFDQQGCLSPTFVFAAQSPGLTEWCATLACSLDAIAAELPRGAAGARARAALRWWRAGAHARQAVGSVTRIWESVGSTDWCVVLLASPSRLDPGLEPPRDRHLVVVPYHDPADVERAFAARLGRLQGLSVGLETAPRLPAWLRATRVAAAGTLQQAPPDWRQDHRAPLWSLIGPEA